MIHTVVGSCTVKGSRHIQQPSSTPSSSTPPIEDAGDEHEAAVNAIGFSNKEQAAAAAEGESEGEELKSAIESKRVSQSKEEKRSCEEESNPKRKAVFGFEKKVKNYGKNI